MATYRIEGSESFGGVRYGVRFVRGKGETSDGAVAHALAELGYRVTEIVDEPPRPAARKRSSKRDRRDH